MVAVGMRVYVDNAPPQMDRELSKRDHGDVGCSVFPAILRQEACLHATADGIASADTTDSNSSEAKKEEISGRKGGRAIFAIGSQVSCT